MITGPRSTARERSSYAMAQGQRSKGQHPEVGVKWKVIDDEAGSRMVVEGEQGAPREEEREKNKNTRLLQLHTFIMQQYKSSRARKTL